MRQNLATRLAVYTILIAILIGTLISSVSIYLSYARTITELEDTATQLLELTLDSATAAVFQLDPELAGNVLSGLMQYPLFVRVSLYDDLGEELATIARPRVPAAGLSALVSIPVHELSYELPLNENGTQAGNLVALLDLQPGMSSFYEQAVITASSQILMAVVLAIVIFMVVVYLVTRPLSDLARSLATTEPGSESRLKIPALHETDELGRLTDSANKYLGAAADYQRELEGSRERLQSILDNLREGVIVVDASGRILECNHATEEMFNFRTEQLVNKPIINLVMDSGFHDFDKLLYEVSRYSHTGLRCRGSKSDQTTFLVELAVAWLSTPGMDLTLWTIRDLSEQEQVERERRELEEQLRQSQKMEAIGTLAGGIAHDFNNFLAGINGYAELALLNDQRGQPIDTNIQQIMRASSKASQLVQRILTFSRKQKEHRRLINLASVADECVDLISQAIPATIYVHADLGDRNFPVVGDESMMHQLLMNLFANAASAMKDNPGEIRLELKVVGSQETGGNGAPDIPMVCITVEDTGPGIPDAILQRIFEPYFTTKSPGEGTGIGLAMVHSIVDSHGGRISASNTEKGARFTIYLPLHEGEEPEVYEDATEKDKIELGDGKILLVEDNEMLAEMFPELLGSLGYEVDLARDGEEGLEKYRAADGAYDLVITDQTMPRMNGDRLIRHIFEIDAGQPVILCTGYSDVVDREKVLAMGVKCFLHKPLTLDEISNGIREALS